MGRGEKKIKKKYLVRRIICGGLVLLGFAGVISFGTVSSKKSEEDIAAIKRADEMEKEIEIEKMYVGLNVTKTDFEWVDKLEKGNKPSKIVLHHSAIEDMTIEEVHEKHIENGWAGIGYHYFVGKDGKIYKGREENIIGAHVKDNNINTLGICIEGNFEKYNPTEEQNESILKLLHYLYSKYEIQDLEGHRDLGQTLCPGENLKVTEIKNNLNLLIEEDRSQKENE
ncbi:MAG: peptidoglycan recognition protein family protein [Sarcina sp.]